MSLRARWKQVGVKPPRFISWRTRDYDDLVGRYKFARSVGAELIEGDLLEMGEMTGSNRALRHDLPALLFY